MPSIARVVKSRYVIIGILLLLVVSLILVLGRQWSLTVRLLSIFIVLLLALLGLVLTSLRATRNASRLEQGLRVQAENQRVSMRPDRRGEIETLQEDFDRAVSMLKRSKLGGQRSGKSALYALPWYLFVGPPGAGKTTAITNSGLNFPVGKAAVRGVGGTRNCDWFFSDSAILLDTAGRYVTDEDDEPEWLAFLELLRKNRPGRPINGVLVGISCTELIGASYEQVEWHADGLRKRLDELVSQLGVSFPVYVVFTKCDLIPGFVEFFEQLSRREREQVWGYTEELASHPLDDVGEVARAEFDKLAATLTRARNDRLALSMKRAERHKTFIFPLEFESLKENVAAFLSRIFLRNPYQESPLFRGFYFTSGTQEGEPIGRVVEAIARRFHLPVTPEGDEPRDAEKRAYFIRDLFADLVVPDQYVVASTRKQAARNRTLRLAAAGAGLLGFALFAVLAVSAALSSRASLSEARQVARQAAAIDWQSREMQDSFARIKALGDLVERRDAERPWFRLGLFEGDETTERLRELRYGLARSFVEERVLPEVEQRLVGGARQIAAARDSLYEDLRAYLLLTEESGRLAAEADAPDDDQETAQSNRSFLGRYLRGVAQEAAAPGRSSGRRDRLDPGLFAPIVDGFVATHGSSQGRPFGGEDRLIQRTRSLLYRRPGLESVYSRIKLQLGDRARPYTLRDAVEGRRTDLFTSGAEVPGFFTREAWDGTVKDAIAQAGENPTRDDWVLGRSEREVPAELREPDQVRAQLEEMYFREYAAAWKRFLSSVEYVPFHTTLDAGRGLSELGDPANSPILYLFGNVAAQTYFEPEQEVLEEGGEMLEEAARRETQRRTTRLRQRYGLDVAGRLGGENGGEQPVNAAFGAIHALGVGMGAEPSPALFSALNGLAEVGDRLGSMSADGSGAFELAEEILDKNGAELWSAMRTIGSDLNQLDAESRSLFVRPIEMAWGAIMDEAQAFANDLWRERVHDPFRFVDMRYPLDAASTDELTIDEFEEFFHPQEGPVPAFREEVLRPFLNANGRPKQWEGRGLIISQRAERAMERVDDIASRIFAGDFLGIEFWVKPETPENGRDVSRITIDLHGQSQQYTMGFPYEDQFRWPGTRSGAEIMVTLADGSQLPAITADGTWALFRLLQQASDIRRSGSAEPEYRVSWRMQRAGGQPVTVRYLFRSRSRNSPFEDPRRFFRIDMPDRLD